MEFGIHLLQAGHLATREANLAFSRRAEDLGFHSLFAAEHVILPRHHTSRYPGNPSGEFPFPPDLPFLEAISLLTFVAAATERIALGTSVLALPMRNPGLTAKSLATLDVLSNGRLIFGVGSGWLREEFEALNVPFDHRGDRLDEGLEIILSCWTQDNPEFKGRFYSLSDVGFYPKPLQKPTPSVWIGGWSDRALRRAAKYANCWHASGTPEILAEGLAKVRIYAKEYGRDSNAISLSVLADDSLTRAEPAEVIENLREYQAAGAAHVLVTFTGRTIERTLERMETFAREVAPKV
ncbi:MAG: LLM class F420-dependent oxidoreductase [Chloroflexi bacterium]|nr:LLM class F420-dependent oxidoreductase [Chloroflexota bacterium]